MIALPAAGCWPGPVILAAETTLEGLEIASPTPDRAAVTIHPLRTADLDGALAANDAVGWPGRRLLFDFYRARDDSALFVAEVGGEIAGTAGKVRTRGYLIWMNASALLAFIGITSWLAPAS